MSDSEGQVWTETASVTITGGNYEQDAMFANEWQTGTAESAILPPPLALDDPTHYRQNRYVTAANTPLVVDGVRSRELTSNDGSRGLGFDLPVAIGLVAAPRNGAIEMKPDGTFVYVPDAGFIGLDTFTSSTFDGLRSDKAVSTIQVMPDADALVQQNVGLHEFYQTSFRDFLDGLSHSILLVQTSGIVPSLGRHPQMPVLTTRTLWTRLERWIPTASW